MMLLCRGNIHDFFAFQPGHIGIGIAPPAAADSVWTGKLNEDNLNLIFDWDLSSPFVRVRKRLKLES
jgi:hypothetical protein